jgi:hypothetical protein
MDNGGVPARDNTGRPRSLAFPNVRYSYVTVMHSSDTTFLSHNSFTLQTHHHRDRQCARPDRITIAKTGKRNASSCATNKIRVNDKTRETFPKRQGGNYSLKTIQQ